MTDYGPYIARIDDWHDGDTLHLTIDLGFAQQVASHDLRGKPQLSCRLTQESGMGIDAPELTIGGRANQAGLDALAYAQQIAPPGTLVMVTSKGWDKYGGRFDGVVLLASGVDLASALVAAGHAVSKAY